jgi:hypothetical protein
MVQIVRHGTAVISHSIRLLCALGMVHVQVLIYVFALLDFQGLIVVYGAVMVLYIPNYRYALVMERVPH